MSAALATSTLMGTNSALTPLHLADFDDLTLRRPGLWLVDFSTAWCPPCRVLTPLLAQLAGELAGNLSIGAVDCDDEQVLSQRFGVTAMPTMLLFRDGRVIAQKVGAMPRAKLLAWLTSSGVATAASPVRPAF
jgi:thioredoxin 1